MYLLVYILPILEMEPKIKDCKIVLESITSKKQNLPEKNCTTACCVKLEKLNTRKIDEDDKNFTPRKQTTLRPFSVNLVPLTPTDLDNVKTPCQESVRKNQNPNFDFPTPQIKAHIELGIELKSIIKERNILTPVTKQRFIDVLDEMKSRNDEETRHFKRESALIEIVNSEITYVHQLETLINFFIKPVQERNLLRLEDFQILFGNISTIYNINKELLEEIEKEYKNVIKAFSKIAPFFKLYSVYASEFKSSLKILQNARILNPVFAKFVENQETRPEVQSKLSALLITPIQRIPRYKLLLAQLHELTSPEDKDFCDLAECVKKISEVAEHINKIVEDQENQQRLLELQRYLKSGEPNIITPGRQLEKEGILMKMSSKNAHSEKLYVVLMNDIIMFNRIKGSKPKVNLLTCNRIFPLNKCKVIPVLDKGCFKIVCQEEELVLYNDSFQETKVWINRIQEVAERYLESKRTLRKESSARRPVKRKDMHEYHEIGLSPGRPLKKRKIAVEPEPETSSKSSNARNVRITSRRPIHYVCNSTPIKLGENESHSDFRLFNTNISLENNHSETKPTSGYSTFVFGQPDKQNVSTVSSFFKDVSSKVKTFLGFRR